MKNVENVNRVFVRSYAREAVGNASAACLYTAQSVTCLAAIKNAVGPVRTKTYPLMIGRSGSYVSASREDGSNQR